MQNISPTKELLRDKAGIAGGVMDRVSVIGSDQGVGGIHDEYCAFHMKFALHYRKHYDLNHNTESENIYHISR